MRALLRLGRREAWQHKARSTLVVVLILIPVALSAGVLVIVPAWSGNPDAHATARFGAAQVLATDPLGSSGWRESPPWGARGRPAAGRPVEAATLTAWVPAGRDGIVASIDAEQVDATDPMLAAKFPITDGRAPERAGEAALSAVTLAELDLAPAH